MCKNYWHYILNLILLTLNINYAQDSLYLVSTFTGTKDSQLFVNLAARDPYEIGMGDINGDGLNDMVMHSYSGSFFDLYLGSHIWNGENKIRFNISQHVLPMGYSNVIGIGDVNGDGFGDFAIDGTKSSLYYQGKVLIYFGSDTVDLNPDFSFSKSYIWDFLSFGSSGDFNNDGYQDFLIRNHYVLEQKFGEAYLFKGGEIISDNPYKVFLSQSEIGFFSENSIFCDINGDSFDDILIIESFLLSGNIPPIPKLYIFYGGVEIKDTPDLVFDLGAAPILFDLHDVNNDGYEDFMLKTADGLPKLYLGSDVFNIDSFIEFSNYDKNLSNLNFGYSIGYIGDINNDGYDDFGINNLSYTNSKGEMVGKLNIYLGGNEIDTIPDYFLIGEAHWGDFGLYLGPLGDINGDGYNEFFVGAPSFPNRTEWLGKIYIYSMKKFIVDVEDASNNFPSEYKLYQNYPNPFNPSTVISYQLPVVSFVTLKVYDVLGSEVATLANEQKPAGNYEVKFDASQLSSGIYFYRLEAGSFAQTRKMILMK